MKRPIKKSDLLWITGFYEGEGYTGSYKQTYCNTQFLTLQISQVDKTPLLYIKNALGFGSVNYYKPYKNVPNGYWRFGCAARKAEWLLKQMLPFMKSTYKIKQAKKALKLYSSVVPPSKRFGKINPNWRGGTAHA